MLALYYGDLLAGTIAIRSGIPHDEDPWEWHCGFYPGCHPGEHQDGTAASFDDARSDFEAAWKVFLAKRTEADVQAGVASKIGPLENMRCGKPAKNYHRRKPSTLMKCVTIYSMAPKINIDSRTLVTRR